MEPSFTFKIFQSMNPNGFNNNIQCTHLQLFLLIWMNLIKNMTLNIRQNLRRSAKICYTSSINIQNLSISSPNTIIKYFQYINRYQLPFALAFCFIDFESQGQTFDHLIIDAKQPPNSVPINMHNIYVTLSWLCSLDKFVILRDIIIE